MQLDLLSYLKAEFAVDFKGSTFNAVFDGERLNGQQSRIYQAMRDECWRTLREIEAITSDPQASISARLRDFNNDDYLKQFFSMEHRRRGEGKQGIWEYRVMRR